MNYVFLADGFEEVEALATVDVLRRCGIEVQTVSISYSEEVTGAHGIIVKADKVLDYSMLQDADFLILPGGLPGATNLRDCEALQEVLKQHAAKGGNLAAICAAPMVLGGLGLLEGKEATCYPGFEKYMIGAKPGSLPVVQDGNVITGKGPAFAFAFGLKIAEAIKGKEDARDVAAGMLLQ